MKVLAIAHECLPEIVPGPNGTNTMFYQGPSPDEVTLVDFARAQGLEFCEGEDAYSKMRKYKYWNPSTTETFKVFRKMEFNSDRKRMSILVKDPEDGKIKLFTKGADSIIKERLDSSQINPTVMASTEDFLTKASVKGLRTLLMAMKVIDEKEFASFNKEV